MVHDLLVGRTPDFVEGLGILTTGFYVPLAMILPFMVMFYFILSVLEDVGYLPRLATLMDNMMHRIGLHGSAIVPSVLGLGCRVPGMLATRMLETQRQRFIVATLLAVCVPCLAQNAVIFGLLSRYGINYVLIVYGTLAMLYILGGLVLSRLLPGASEEILLEIPPYRRPNAKSLAKKTWMRVRYFLYDAVPYIVLGVLGVNLLYLVGFMQAFSRFFGPVFSTLFGLPEEAVVALMLGFLRKDFAVGMLAPIPMSPMQLTVASTLLVTFAPCLATLTVMYRELGLKGFLNAMVFMALMTVSTGVMMRWLLL
jgi:ferrous iron transport protein B